MPKPTTTLPEKRRKSSATLNAHTVARLRKDGYVTANVQKFNHVIKRYNDLYGFIDILAMGEGELLAIQATSTTNLQSRVTKSLENKNLIRWLSIPAHRFECWGWSKKGKAGTRKLWTLRRIIFVKESDGAIKVFEGEV